MVYSQKTSNMNKKTFIILFLLSLFIVGKSAPTNEDSRITRIDMNKYQRISFDSLVEDLSCIKLKNSSFKYCINLIPYKNNFYIMGASIAGRNVSIYDKSGKSIKEITLPDAILVNSMCIVPELEELWVTSRFKVINKYKLNGTLSKRVSLPFPCATVMPLGRQEFLIYSGGANAPKGNIQGHFMALTDFKSIQKLFLPKIGHREFPFAPYTLYTKDADRLYIFPDNIDTIYSCNFRKREVSPLYALDFHGDFLTKEKQPNGDREMNDIIVNRKYIYNQYSFYQASNKLFFKLTGKREDFCMINLKNHSLCSFDRLFNDFKPNDINPIVGSDGRNLYVLARTKDLLEHYQNIKCTYPSIRKLLSSSSKDEDSWILISIKIK